MIADPCTKVKHSFLVRKPLALNGLRSGAGGARKPLIVSDLQLQRRKPLIINNLQHLKYYYLFGLFSLFALFATNLLTLHIFIFIYFNRGSLFI